VSVSLEYCRLGLQYYVAGRQAAFADLNPLAANLLHHAVEMFLKGAIVRRSGDPQALRGPGHTLVKMWRALEDDRTDRSAGFEPIIARLERFAWVRYPASLIREGIRARIDLGPGSRPHPAETSVRGQPPHHGLRLCEIDALIRMLYDAAGFDERLLTDFNATAHEALSRPPTALLDVAYPDLVCSD
jgi:hypothetical protein